MLRLSTLLIHLFELIEECFIADLQDLRRLATIPSRLVQNLNDVCPFRLHGRPSSNFEQ